MKMEKFNKVIQELKKIGIVLVTLIILSKLIFFKEDFLVVIKFWFTMFWSFVLPGFLIMTIFREKFDFIERLIIGSVLGLAFMSLVSYVIGLIGIHLRIHGIIIPVFVVGLYLYLEWKNGER